MMIVLSQTKKTSKIIDDVVKYLGKHFIPNEKSPINKKNKRGINDTMEVEKISTGNQ